MYYFVPSWYQHERKWYDRTPYWFRVFQRMSFDDTVNQMKMFMNAESSVTLLLLNYQPQLRYLLLKQELLGVPYWSFFDDIQNLSHSYTKPIYFQDLHWPEGCEFLYSPFAVIVKQYGKVFAIVHFAENGNLHSISFEKDGKARYDHIFDDRGFLSSILYYDEEGEADYQDYLNSNGFWQVREHLKKGRPLGNIEVNSLADRSFDKVFYKDWEELLQERLERYKEKSVSDQDVFIIASDDQHNQLILDTYTEQQKVFSFFNNRFDLDDTNKLQNLVDEATFLVVDSEKGERALREACDKLDHANIAISRLSPFDTRLRLGQSQSIKEQIIYFYLDGVTQEELYLALLIILDLMALYSEIELHLVTFQQDYDLKHLQDWIESEIRAHYQLEDFYTSSSLGENALEDDQELELERIKLTCFNSEDQLIEVLDTARLVVDLGLEPDLYTQIASISAGVPQINRVKTDYVSHQQNGWLLDSIEELQEAILYYFLGLANWNSALVYAVQMMGDYTGGQILEKWLELLNNSKRSTS